MAAREPRGTREPAMARERMQAREPAAGRSALRERLGRRHDGVGGRAAGGAAPPPSRAVVAPRDGAARPAGPAAPAGTDGAAGPAGAKSRSQLKRAKKRLRDERKRIAHGDRVGGDEAGAGSEPAQRRADGEVAAVDGGVPARPAPGPAPAAVSAEMPSREAGPSRAELRAARLEAARRRQEDLARTYAAHQAE
jgi:hypothetical protein